MTNERAGDHWPERQTNPTASVTDAGDIPRQLRARRDASRRLPAFCSCGHRDPLTHRIAPDGPSTFGLSAAELRKHANHLVSEHGWSVAEVRQVLDLTAVAR